MAPERKVVLCSIALIGVTLPISYYFYKKWKRNKLYKYIESIQTYKSPNSQTFQVVDENAIKDILDLADEFKILAIDAEWVQKGINKIALLQISFPNGKCFLINHRQKLPDKFLAMLENGSILKIGIGILDEDIKRFKSQWNIQPKGLVELKYLTKMFYPDIQKLGAKNLAMKFLNVTLDKHWKISASDWEAEEFTPRQIKYAANDVLTAMAIVLKIVAEQRGVDDLEELLRVTYDLCLQHKDIPFKGMYRFFFTF